MLKQNCHLDRSAPGFPASLHWTEPRVRLSFKERRMVLANATNFHRKSGVAQWRDLRFLFLGSRADSRAPEGIKFPSVRRTSLGSGIKVECLVVRYHRIPLSLPC